MNVPHMSTGSGDRDAGTAAADIGPAEPGAAGTLCVVRFAMRRASGLRSNRRVKGATVPRLRGRSAEQPEELAHVGDQQVWLLHGGEVAAAVELGPVHDGVR